MNPIKEHSLFFRQALRDLNEVGSIIPSSRATGRAMTAAFRNRTAPARVLEAGAGTGPITIHIVKDMRDGDQLDMFEINPDYAAFLEKRFEHEEPFKRVKEQCRVYADMVESLEKVPTYDYVITAVPHASLPLEIVESVFSTYKAVLKPGGILTYIEFAFSKDILKTFTFNKAKRERVNAISNVISGYIDEYQIDHQFVLRNAPPARIRSFQF